MNRIIEMELLSFSEIETNPKSSGALSPPDNGRHTLKIEWTGLVHTGAKKSSTRINVDSVTVK